MIKVDEPPAHWSHPHEKHDWIALQLARQAAAHIREHPESIPIAQERLERWINQGGLSAQCTDTHYWLHLVQTLTANEIADLLESPAERATQLRSSLPFIRPPFIDETASLKINQKAFRVPENRPAI